PLRGVAVRPLDRDVVHVGPASLDGDDLILPLLLLEPAVAVKVLAQRLLLAGKAEADLAEEHLRRLAHRLDVPAAVLAGPAPREDAEVEQQELHRLAHRLARSGKNDPMIPGVAVAVVVGAEEGGHDRLRRAKDDVGDFLDASANAGLEPETHEELLQL